MQLTKAEALHLHTALYPLLKHPLVRQMNQYMHHGNTSCLTHCLTVTYYSYAFVKRLHLQVDEESLIRGALLHDFFLYDWHVKENHQRFHGFRHPSIALENAHKHFSLTDKEVDIIKHHMWPLTPIPPHCKEAYIVTMMDKWCSLKETINRPCLQHFIKHCKGM